MVFVLMIYMWSMGDFNLVYDDLGFYENIQFYEFNDKYVVVGRRDAGIALIDLSGKLLRRYQKPGQGPKDLQHPFLMGESEGELLVVSNGRNILSFDSDLTPRADAISPLSLSLSSSPSLYGLAKGPNSFLLLKSGLSPAEYLVWEVVYQGKQWKRKAAYFQQKETIANNRENNSQNFRINAHGGWFFKTIFGVENEYEVSVHRLPTKHGEDGEIVQILLQSVEDFPRLSPRYRIAMLDSLKTEKGYAVTFKARGETGDNPSIFVDIFLENGTFVRRDALESSLAACINCEEIWILGESADGQEVFRQWNAYLPLQTGE